MAGAAARYQDGQTATVHDVCVTVTGDDLLIVGAEDTVLARWPLAAVRRTGLAQDTSALRLGLGHGPGARLVVNDPATIAVLNGRCPNLDRKPGKEPGWWKPYAIWGGAAAVSVVLLFTVIIPTFARQAAHWMPVEWERALGERVEPQVRRLMGGDYCGHGDGLQVLRGVGAQLAQAGGYDGPLEIRVLSSDTANAMALPGGRILILKGLIDKADNPNGLIGVLAHEIGHVKERHALTGVMQSSVTAALLSLLLGDVTGGTALVILGETLTSASYSRDMERDADQFAIETMRENGFDVQPLATLLKKITGGADNGPIPQWLSTHPATDARAARIDAAERAGGAALTPGQWKAVQTVCG